MNIASLTTEINTDPQGYGYAPYVSAKDTTNLLSILNFVRDGVTPCPVNGIVGPVATVTRTVLPKNTFLSLTTAVAVRLALGLASDGVTSLSSALVTTWQTVLTQARAADPGSNINLALISSIGNPVTSNVITQTEYNAIYLQNVSRAVLLFGVPVRPANTLAAVGF